MQFTLLGGRGSSDSSGICFVSYSDQKFSQLHMRGHHVIHLIYFSEYVI